MQPRVLINAASLWHGGSSRNYHRNLLRELDRDPRGFRFSVLAPAGELTPEELGSLELIEVRLPQRLRSPVRVVWEQLVLPRRAADFDLLYCTSDLSPSWGATPTVVALRNLNVYDRRFYDDTRTRVMFRLARSGARHAAAVVTPSAVAIETVTRELGLAPGKANVVPHGISLEAFDGDSRSSESGAPYVFLPANLERHKNIDVMIESLVHLAEPRVEIVVAGGRVLDADCAADLEALARARGVTDRVHFIGPVPYREILAYYRGAAALVFPSLLESFGHPLLEAMLAGTPIIASDLPIFHEVAADSALYFPPTDAEALAQAIRSVLERPAEARARVDCGHARVREFSWARSTDRLCAVFEHVLGERGSGND